MATRRSSSFLGEAAAAAAAAAALRRPQEQLVAAAASFSRRRLASSSLSSPAAAAAFPSSTAHGGAATHRPRSLLAVRSPLSRAVVPHSAAAAAATSPAAVRSSLRRGGASLSSPLRATLLFRPSSARLGSNFEDYYGMVEFATKIQSPMVIYMWWGWAIAQVLICAAALFHSNYYFSGRMLPKSQGNTQLCEDSW